MTLGIRATDAGGEIVPHWFLEKDFVEIKSPDGVPVRVKSGARRDPVTVVAFGSNDVKATQAYYKDTLRMKEQRGGLLKLLGPLAGDGPVLGYDGSDVSVVLVKEDAPVTQGQIFDKIAILTKNTVGMADAISKTSYGKVEFVGEAPGIGTKVADTIDPEFHDVVFVDYGDFEKELV
eukprot:TRINITY_DN7976_c0_g1_i2.p1 TRINITY_DN7976_c0_g1~~TRINITY_DN7976_c0_g1_i2.p1  ORF type:complete len:177 (-),score=83.49 TRINITY_DN7976_c0_g1_i2:277-807(-)